MANTDRGATTPTLHHPAVQTSLNDLNILPSTPGDLLLLFNQELQQLRSIRWSQPETGNLSANLRGDGWMDLKEGWNLHCSREG